MVSVPRASPLLRVALDRARLHLTESTSLPGGDVTDFPVTGQMRQQSGASPVLLLCYHTLSFFVPMRAPVRRSPCIPPPQSHWQHPPPHTKGQLRDPSPSQLSPTKAPSRRPRPSTWAVGVGRERSLGFGHLAYSHPHQEGVGSLTFGKGLSERTLQRGDVESPSPSKMQPRSILAAQDPVTRTL